MYRSDLNTRDRGGAIAAVVAIHAALLFALLNASGHIDLTDTQNPIRVFEVTEEPPPPEPEPVQQQQQERERPREAEGAASPENIRSEATAIVDPEPRIALPLPVPMETTETPNQGVQPTQGAAEVPGPGTGAGGIGTGTGAGAGGAGPGGGGGGGVAVRTRLATPPLSARDFPRELLRIWPRRARALMRFRVSADGQIIECILDRGTGVPAIDSQICNIARASELKRKARELDAMRRSLERLAADCHGDERPDCPILDDLEAMDDHDPSRRPELLKPAEVERHPNNAYGVQVSTRTLFPMLVAVAVLFAPALTRAGEAFAAVPDHHVQMMTSGHCKAPPSHSGDNKPSDHDKAGMDCCISMCMAVAVAPPAPPQSATLHGPAATFPLANQYHGCVAEIATPPPRLA